MTNIDFTEIEIDNLITHSVGNKLRDEKIVLSVEETTIDEETKNLLLKYFLLPIKTEEFYSFSHSIELEMNEIYTVVRKLFSDNSLFINSSQDIAKLLYEQSMHPKIKEGKLNVSYFSKVIIDDEIVDAIGIFKSEKDVPFLKMNPGQTNFDIQHEYGFELKGIDKGCLILNTNADDGYKLFIIDNANKSVEAQYWKDDFLKVKPLSNEFFQTNQFLSITKNYITKELTKEFDITRTDQIDLLNRSVEFFKSKDNFNKQTFESEVLQDNNIIESFKNFNELYQQENDIKVDDSFEISANAVKKQARVFKSVIKLDKNFHIYIHGNKELIEQGIDNDGRKYYKIYYNEEK
ncbi:nucleoid-associated protein [Maribellus maritimus]|uniref:nucleoid-associated protein n=1 Tax=Maribellus maritimus TaxID=2870838 RepID=UPI001EEBB0CD|nr:nucleoid-associated protein [Maribellus maritimus]MCG6189949.1 nucleoid-associated protein [Maribellus maritimus]